MDLLTLGVKYSSSLSAVEYQQTQLKSQYSNLNPLTAKDISHPEKFTFLWSLIPRTVPKSAVTMLRYVTLCPSIMSKKVKLLGVKGLALNYSACFNWKEACESVKESLEDRISNQGTLTGTGYVLL